MSGQDLVVRQKELIKRLYAEIEQYAKLGRIEATEDCNRKREEALETQRLKASGESATSAERLMYLSKDVLNARFKHGEAETLFKAQGELINAIKLEMRITEEQIKREWGNS